jgi:PKD repeat protein
MKASTFLAAAIATAALTACTVHKTDEAPPLTGPSGFALSVTMAAIPDSISQDGGSQSSIRVTAIGPNGRPLASVPFRIDTFVNGVGQDYGTLSARTIVTNVDGVATVTYTAPPSPSNGIFGTCRFLPGTCIDILATPTGSDFLTAVSQSVQIRLVPPGVILPPVSGPTPSFTVTPSSPSANIPVQFDASLSCGEPLVGGACPPTRSITQYHWNFGDGTTGTGRTISHSFALAQAYTVTLTLTNDVGATASRSQVILVGSGALPNPSFTASPQAPAVGQLVFFNAQASTPGPGHTIAAYRWTFGDGTTANGVTVSHAYAAQGVYSVQLTVVDEAGQSATSAPTLITVGSGAGSPTAVFTYSPPSPVPAGTSVTFDASPSSGTAGGSAPATYQWQFECPASGTGACASPVATTTSPRIAHTFNTVGTFSVILTVFDTAGRSGTTSRLITVQ